MSTEEKWKPVVGYEGYYEVSNLARVKTVYRSFLRKDGWRMVVNEKIRKQVVDTDGYLNIRLCIDGSCKSVSVHIIVAETWVTKPKEEQGVKLEVNHKDGNKLNCLPDNLEWGTHLHNMQHAWSNNLATSNSRLGKADFERLFELRNNGVSYSKISKELNYSRGHLMGIVNGYNLNKRLKDLGIAVKKENNLYIVYEL